MAGNNIYNNRDSLEINELAALSNEDVSPELIEQLQQKLMNADESLAASAGFDENDDTTLFEEPKPKIEVSEISENENNNIESPDAEKKPIDDTKEKAKRSIENLNNSGTLDDNFIKKYKARLNKQKLGAAASDGAQSFSDISNDAQKPDSANPPIEELSEGKISEKEITEEQKEYNDSLDFLDGNTKYSKYVVYIEPQNVDFIEGLSVKERKNLINKILREQDDILITRQRFGVIQTVIKHVIAAVLTIAISIPVIYYTINASLEASINNHRRAQTNFQTLYKTHGKITNNN